MEVHPGKGSSFRIYKYYNYCVLNSLDHQIRLQMTLQTRLESLDSPLDAQTRDLELQPHRFDWAMAANLYKRGDNSRSSLRT